VLVEHAVRHVGDRVAIRVAETLDQARDGAELIEIDYEPLPCVSSVTDATASGAPLHHVQLLTDNRFTACFIEPRGAIGLGRGSAWFRAAKIDLRLEMLPER
jgi:carbon-monoxide dehydrogenase large subunit